MFKNFLLSIAIVILLCLSGCFSKTSTEYKGFEKGITAFEKYVKSEHNIYGSFIKFECEYAVIYQDNMPDTIYYKISGYNESQKLPYHIIIMLFMILIPNN